MPGNEADQRCQAETVELPLEAAQPAGPAVAGHARGQGRGVGGMLQQLQRLAHRFLAGGAHQGHKPNPARPDEEAVHLLCAQPLQESLLLFRHCRQAQDGLQVD